MKPTVMILALLSLLLLAGCIQYAHIVCGPGALETIAERIGNPASNPVTQTLTCGPVP
jgi:hypothetical protein